MVEYTTQDKWIAYYSLVLKEGIITKETLVEKYKQGEGCREAWEEYAKKGMWQTRDYSSYCSCQNALRFLLKAELEA